MNLLEYSTEENNLLFFNQSYFWLARRKVDDIPLFLELLKRKPSSRVLDLGGGFGRLAKEFARLNHEVTVVDRCLEMLKFGEEYIAPEPVEVKTRISWLHRDITYPLDELPLNWFGVAVCAHNVINEIIEEINLYQLFINIHDHLEANGIAFISRIENPDYKRFNILELIDIFTDDNQAEWIVSTVVSPNKTALRKHQLTFFYEKYIDGKMNEKLTKTINRCIWTIAEIKNAADNAGLRYLESLDDDKILVFQKVN